MNWRSWLILRGNERRNRVAASDLALVIEKRSNTSSPRRVTKPGTHPGCSERLGPPRFSLGRRPDLGAILEAYN